MANYFDKERICQERFDRALSDYGGIWHICTPGDFTYSFNLCENDFKFSVSNVAISAAEAGLVIISDQMMSNHLHVVAAFSDRMAAFDFIDRFRYRQRRYLRLKGLHYNLEGLAIDDPIPIESLLSVRNEIVYCNRNGFLVDPMSTPFSYPWGSGCLYFNSIAYLGHGIQANDLPYRLKRLLSHRSSFVFPDRYAFGDGMILPSSYADFALGQSFFRDAHHYFSMISKDHETFSREAVRYGDRLVVTDEELFSVVVMLAEKSNRGIPPSLLPVGAKVNIARILRKDYHASSNQIRRLLKMEKNDVDRILGL